MQLHRDGTTPTTQAPEATFTGDVRISGHVQRPAPSRLVSATVTFAPGARTPWKVNPLGQTLIVLSGVGRAQGEDEAVVVVSAGDTIWCPPGQRHWEGAAPDSEMTYVALHEGAVQLLRAVTDAEYLQEPAGASAS